MFFWNFCKIHWRIRGRNRRKRLWKMPVKIQIILWDESREEFQGVTDGFLGVLEALGQFSEDFRKTPKEFAMFQGISGNFRWLLRASGSPENLMNLQELSRELRNSFRGVSRWFCGFQRASGDTSSMFPGCRGALRRFFVFKGISVGFREPLESLREVSEVSDGF